MSESATDAWQNAVDDMDDWTGLAVPRPCPMCTEYEINGQHATACLLRGKGGGR